MIGGFVNNNDYYSWEQKRNRVATTTKTTTKIKIKEEQNKNVTENKAAHYGRTSGRMDGRMDVWSNSSATFVVLLLSQGVTHYQGAT